MITSKNLFHKQFMLICSASMPCEGDASAKQILQLSSPSINSRITQQYDSSVCAWVSSWLRAPWRISARHHFLNISILECNQNFKYLKHNDISNLMTTWPLLFHWIYLSMLFFFADLQL